MMITTEKISAKSALPRSATPLLPRAASRARRVAAKAAEQHADKEASRRDFLAAVGLLGSLTAAQAAQAATDPYEEMRSITASRTGSTTSLLESFSKTRDAVSSSKLDRGIRERLAAEASSAVKPSSSSSSSSGGFKLSPAAPKPAAPVAAAPAAPKPSLSLFGSGPKPQAPKPQAPKPAPVPPKAPVAPKAKAAAAAASGSGGALGPVIQAAGVLGLVGVGANAVTSFATSNKKGSKPKAASATPAAAAAPPASSTGKVKAGTSKVTAGTGKIQTGGTGKVSATQKVTKSATGKVTAAASSTGKVVKKVPATAAAAAGTVKGTIKQALVNEEKPDEPTDFAVAGFLGFAALLGAFLTFGLPQPKVVEPEPSPQASDPLVEMAREGARTAASSSYKSPLFKSKSDAEQTTAERKRIAAAAEDVAAKVAPALKVEVPAAAPAPVVKVEAPKPAPTPAPAPAAVAPPPAPVVPAPAPAPKAEAPKPAAPVATAKKAEEKKPAPVAAAAAKKEEQQQTTSPLFVVLAGLGVVVGAFALVGSSNSSSTEGASSSSTTAAAAAPPTAEGEAAAAAAPSASAAAAESVSAAASAAAASAPGQEAAGNNAAYEKAVNALFSDPDTSDDLYSIIQPALRNAPALAWALVSNATNAETLDGWAFQKLSKNRYERVRGLLLKMGLELPATPKPQPIINMTTPAGAAELDPEKLRAVFEALLANPASRTLMKKLLSGAGMPFNEEAFEEQIKDSTYFNLAIAPILRKMPPQKLAVLADLQDPTKLQELVRNVSSLAADTTQLEAVTAELSGDVRNTVEKIRETESTTTTAASR